MCLPSDIVKTFIKKIQRWNANRLVDLSTSKQFFFTVLKNRICTEKKEYSQSVCSVTKSCMCVSRYTHSNQTIIPQEHNSLSNAILHNSAVSAKHTHVKLYSVGLLVA